LGFAVYLQLLHFTGQMVYSVRMQCGRVLAREAWVNADIVSSVPESGTAAAHGFSREVRETLLIIENRHI
jgi:amidophosphoribosyltransferase